MQILLKTSYQLLMSKLSKLLLILLFLLISVSGMSQAMWILIFGDKLSNDKLKSGITVSFAGVDMYGVKEAKMAPNWALGGFMDIALFKNKKWVTSVDFTFKSPFGARNFDNYFDDIISDSVDINKDRMEVNNTAFSLPLYMKYKTKFIAFGAGLQMSLVYKATLKYHAITSEKHTIKISQNVNKKVNKFDIGPFVMFEFLLNPNKHYNGLRLGARYFYGLLTPLKSKKGVHNATLMATLCIPIGGKKSVLNEVQ